MGRDPEDMTPEERIQRVIELMAIASIRYVTELRAGKIKEQPEIPTASKFISRDPRFRNKKGPLPFGYIWTKYGYAAHEGEQVLINRIKELAESGLSSGKIAKHLNNADKKSRRARKWSRTAVWRILKQLTKNNQ